MADDTSTTNISSPERWTTAFVGGGLATYGLIRRSPASLAMAVGGLYLIYRGSTGHCPAYQAAGFNGAANENGEASDQNAVRQNLGASGTKVTHAVSINKSPAELYAFWRDFTHLPRIMDHLESVTVQDGGRSHWVAKVPLGRTVEWDAEIINEVPNELIAWRSLPSADVDSAGSVRFQSGPIGHGTEVRVELSYSPPSFPACCEPARI